MPLSFDDPRTDAELLNATRGDPESFAVFYRRHVKETLRFFILRARDPELAADLMAETFAAALLASRRYRAREEPAVSWLFAIAQHKLADSRRRGRVRDAARRKLGVERLVLDDDDLARVEQLADLDRDGGTYLGLVDELPVGQRHAIRARVVDERDYADIACELRCSEAVVRQRVSRGLETLRLRLEEPS